MISNLQLMATVDASRAKAYSMKGSFTMILND